MKRWNLQQIILYSHDNRSRPLDLIPGTVNIITGDSNTGKTAVADIIDYCLGSSRCNIPDFVKLRCAWAATLWIRDSTRIFLARRVPDLYRQTTSDYCLYSGSEVTVPTRTDQLSDTASNGGLRRFEDLLGIGEVRGETLGATTRTPKRVSLRNAMAFLFQTADIIINPSVLLRGTQDQRRQDIFDAFPYFLGVVDEDSAAREAKLRRLRRELRRLEREQKEAEALADQHSRRIDELAQRGIELGMLSPHIGTTTQSESLQILRDLAGWHRGTTGGGEPPSLLSKLRAEERTTRTQLRAVGEQREAAEQIWRDASEFRSTSERQTRRLETINLLGEETDSPHCPF
jgi:hypothetical protein